MSIAPQRRGQIPSAATNKVHTILTVSHICRQSASFAEDLSLRRMLGRLVESGIFKLPERENLELGVD